MFLLSISFNKEFVVKLEGKDCKTFYRTIYNNKTKSLLDAIIKSVLQCPSLASLQSLIAKPYC